MTEHLNSDFEEGMSFGIAEGRRESVRSSVIKATDVRCSGVKKIEVEHGSNHESSVVLHRESDVIQSVEVVCSCGKATLITLEYEGR